MAVFDWIILSIFFLCLLGIVTWVVKPGKVNTIGCFLSGRILPDSMMDIWYKPVGLALLNLLFTMHGGLKGILTNSVQLLYIHIKQGFTCFSGFEEQIAEVGNRRNGWHVVNSPEFK